MSTGPLPRQLALRNEPRPVPRHRRTGPAFFAELTHAVGAVPTRGPAASFPSCAGARTYPAQASGAIRVETHYSRTRRVTCDPCPRLGPRLLCVAPVQRAGSQWHRALCERLRRSPTSVLARLGLRSPVSRRPDEPLTLSLPPPPTAFGSADLCCIPAWPARPQRRPLAKRPRVPAGPQVGY